ncbi:hypothetical protein Tco_0081681 [Tanacetum coccineum]
MVESQLAEEEVRGLEPGGDGIATLKGPTKPVLQTQTTPSSSPAFFKENINVLRTMIKEHDHQTKTKATPRKLVYADSERESPDRSMSRSFFDRLSLESSSTSDTRSKAHSTDKSQKSLSKRKKTIAPQKVKEVREPEQS